LEKSPSGDLGVLNEKVMKKNTPKNSTKIVLQAVKASRKQSRDEEIKTYGKPLNYNKVIASKKVYNRKKKLHKDTQSFNTEEHRDFYK